MSVKYAILAAYAALGMIWQSAGAEDFPPFPTQFLQSRGPEGSGLNAPLPIAAPLEHSQSVNGLTLTPVSPIFTGQNGNYSYLRIANANNVTTNTNVYVVGTTTATTYGSAHATVPPGASIQYGIADILNAAGVSTTIGGEAVSLYLQNPSPYQAFQHVIWNSGTGYFENMSNCVWLNGDNYHVLNQGIMNAYTTLISAYPSQIIITNLLNTSVQMSLQVYESTTGAYQGTYNGTAVANGVYAIPMANIEAAINWVPTGSQYNANIVITSPTTSGFYAIVGQVIYNSQLLAYLNMSVICPINY